MADAAEAAEARSPAADEATRSAVDAPVKEEAQAVDSWQGFLQPTLLGMPVDVLLQIWLHLDDVRQLTRVNRKLHSLSRDRHFQAKFFISRYSPWSAIFHAIARPKLFHPGLLKRLLMAGAVLSRVLVQTLIVQYGNMASGHRTSSSWGAHLSLVAYTSVLTAGAQRFGNIPLQPGKSDQRFFEQWLAGKHEKHAAIRKLFERYKFMPMPLGSVYDPRYDWRYGAMDKMHSLQNLAKALCKDPSLAPIVMANGYLPAYSDSLCITRHVFTETVGADAIVEKIEALQDSRIAWLTRTVASNVLSGLRPSGNCKIHGRPCDCITPVAQKHLDAYEALLQLDRNGSLEFSLRDVVIALLELLSAVPSNPSLPPLLQALSKDFADLPLSKALVPAVFRRAEEEKLTVAQIHEQLDGHTVSIRELGFVAQSNSTQSALCLEYGMQRLEHFSAQDFIDATLEKLVMQPYKGRMLRDLLRVAEENPALDVRTPLTRAIERLDFAVADLPETSLDIHGRGAHAGWHSTVRSLLSFDWSSMDDMEPDIDDVAPRALTGFTIFGYNADGAAKIIEGMRQDVERHKEKPSSAPGLKPVDDQIGLGDVEDRSLREIGFAARDGYAGATRQRQNAVKMKASNVYGQVPHRATSLAREVVRALGSSSLAASVILKHAVVNQHHALVVELVDQLHVPVTGCLLDISAKLGLAIAPGITAAIIKGAPFVSGTDEVEATSPRRPSTALTAAEQAAVVQWQPNNQHDRYTTVLLRTTRDGTLDRLETILGYPSATAVCIPAPPAPSAALDDVPVGSNAPGSSGAVSAREELKGADQPFAQRRSARRAAPRASYVDGTASASEDGYNSESDDREDMWIEYEASPELVDKQRLEKMLENLKSWRGRIAHLLAAEDRKLTIGTLVCEKMMGGPAHSYARYCSSATRTHLAALDRTLATRNTSLKRATPAVAASGMAEVHELWEELPGRELKMVKERVARGLKKMSGTRHGRYRRSDRRWAFLRSGYSKPLYYAKQIDEDDDSDEDWRPANGRVVPPSLDFHVQPYGYSYPSSDESTDSEAETAPKRIKTEPGDVSAGKPTRHRRQHESRRATTLAGDSPSGDEISGDDSSDAEGSSGSKTARKGKSSKAGTKRKRDVASASESDAASSDEDSSAEPEQQQLNGDTADERAIFLAATTIDMRDDDSELSELESDASAISDAPSDEL